MAKLAATRTASILLFAGVVSEKLQDDIVARLALAGNAAIVVACGVKSAMPIALPRDAARIGLKLRALLRKFKRGLDTRGDDCRPCP